MTVDTALPLPPQVAGLVLCGGKSSRMGAAKALLPFGPELMLQRVVRLLSDAVSTVVVVAAPDQHLPPLPPGVHVAHDTHPGSGPLGGIYTGMKYLAGVTGAGGEVIESVYATSCDSPFLSPAFVRYMVGCLKGRDAAVPMEQKFLHPLAAAYQLSLLPAAEKLMEAGRMRPVFLFENADVARIPLTQLAADLQSDDPGLKTLTNMNDPAAYVQALEAAGFEIDPALAAKLGLK